jgi:hypothetical protein
MGGGGVRGILWVRGKGRQGNGKSHNKELNDLYYLPNIVRVVKSR